MRYSIHKGVSLYAIVHGTLIPVVTTVATDGVGYHGRSILQHTPRGYRRRLSIGAGTVCVWHEEQNDSPQHELTHRQR